MLAHFHSDSKVKEISTCVGPSLIDFEKVEQHKIFTASSSFNSYRQSVIFYINGMPVFEFLTDRGLTSFRKSNASAKNIGKKYRFSFVRFNQEKL